MERIRTFASDSSPELQLSTDTFLVTYPEGQKLTTFKIGTQFGEVFIGPDGKFSESVAVFSLKNENGARAIKTFPHSDYSTKHIAFSLSFPTFPSNSENEEDERSQAEDTVSIQHLNRVPMVRLTQPQVQSIIEALDAASDPSLREKCNELVRTLTNLSKQAF